MRVIAAESRDKGGGSALNRERGRGQPEPGGPSLGSTMEKIDLPMGESETIHPHEKFSRLVEVEL